MKPNSDSFVIGICSPSGGGKTALVKKLTELMENSVTISFDDYGDPFWDIPDFDKWITQGADLNLISTPKLSTDLEALRKGQRIHSPSNQVIIEPKKIILFDTLVGRSHNATGRFIDYLVYIDTPLELTLARRIMRMLTVIPTDNINLIPSREQIENLSEYLAAYSSQSGPRQIYHAIQRQAKNLSDLVLDGEKPINSLAADVIEAVNYDVDSA
ncbi:MAG: hypothetical protein JRD71_10825 [Deltaproteobacteria bacterium]|nr:hypothetical protein [Deltaproteobacteria bacterium]